VQSNTDNGPPAASSRAQRLTPTDWCTLLVLLAGIPFIARGLQRVELDNDVEEWLPYSDSDGQILRWHHEHFDPRERFVVSWDSSSLDDPRLERLAAELADPPDSDGIRRGRDRRIDRVTTPRDLIARMHDNNIPLDLAIERCVGVAIGRGFLKVKLTREGRLQSGSAKHAVLKLLNDLHLRAEILPAVPSQASKDLPRSDGPASLDPGDDSEDELAGPLLKIPEHDFQVRWHGMTPAGERIREIQELLSKLRAGGDDLVEQSFFAPGAPAAITVVLSPIGSQSVSRTIEVVQSAAARIGIPADELRLGGGPVGRSRLNQMAERALWNPEYPAWNLFKRSPILLSMLVGSVLVLVLLKSIRQTLIVLIASAYVCLATVALVPALGDSLNMVLVVMPPLLLVVTMSGAIHLINYWKREAAIDPSTAVANAVRIARVPCALASITTAIGTASLETSSLSPIREFGFYSTIGVLLSLAMVLLGVPTLLKLMGGCPTSARSGFRDRSLWRDLGRVIAKYHWATQFLIAVVFIQAVWGLKWFRTETKVIKYFPSHLRIIQDYDFFEQALAGVVNVDVVLHFRQSALSSSDVSDRLELVRNVEAELRKEAGVTGTLSIADFRNTISRPDDGARRIAVLIYHKGLHRLKSGIFGDESDTEPANRRSASNLAAIVSKPLLVEQAGRLVDAQVGDEIWRVRVQCTVLNDLSYDSLLANLEYRIQPLLKSIPGSDYLVTGSVPLFLRAQQVLLKSLISSLGLAFLLITVVVMVLLKSFLGGIYAMLPNIFPIGVAFGWISWMNVPVDVGTMMTASIALGIAIDGTLHLITWFEECLAKERHRAEAVRNALDYCGPALFQTSLIISAAMLMLTGADLLLISRFGWLMALLIMAALAGDVILLPALLASHMGLVLKGTVKPGRHRSHKRSRDEGHTTHREEAGEPASPASEIRGA
jgi:uncharacterized protein